MTACLQIGVQIAACLGISPSKITILRTAVQVSVRAAFGSGPCFTVLLLQVKLPYHIRVIVACYKEDLDCIKRTVKAANAATLPYGCRRTIYL